MSEYPKIETLYERDPKTFYVTPGKFKNPVYALIKEWEFTEKIDGTNIRIMWYHLTHHISIKGRTDAANIHPDLMAWITDHVSVEALASIFPDCDVVIYGEGYGAGIQKVGSLYSPTKKFIMFDVLVDGHWWLSHSNVMDIASKLELETVPYVGSFSLDQATEMVRAGMASQVGTCQAEGLVGRTIEPLFDKRRHRLIVKLKTKDFEPKAA